MCGICGIFNFDNKKVKYEDLNKINNRMIFRGPDDEGSFISGSFGMAMRRLSIIDLDTGKQPISNDQRDVHIILNGEIYNYIELKEELTRIGINFKTNSDTEVLLEQYIQFGEKFIDKINGIYSFAIYDKKKNKLLIYRDRIGIKPLYYFKDDKKFIFSSNIDSLSKILKTNISINSIYSYFTTNYVPANASIHNNIKKLLPGNFIRIENNNFQINNYWSLKYNNKVKSKNNIHYEVEELLEDIVKIQSRTDVKIGSFLSGGVDSSILTYLLNKNVKNFETYTIDFSGKDKNQDIEFSYKLSSELNLRNKKLKLNLEKDLLNYLDDIIYFLDEPISDTAIFSTFALSKLAYENNTKVIITGAGGDEIFGGYHRHYDNNIFKKIFPNIKVSILFNFLRFLKKDYYNHFLKLLSKDVNFILGTSGISLNLISKLLNDQSSFFNNFKNLTEYFTRDFSYENLENKLKIDMSNYLPDNILSLTDKMSMANSIEVRTPYLDHRLIEKVYYSNNENIFGNNIKQSKKILKKIFFEKIKTNFWERDKEGFNAPSNVWVYNNKYYLIKYFNENTNKILKEILDLDILILNIKNINSLKDKKIHSIFSIFLLNKWLSLRYAE